MSLNNLSIRLQVLIPLLLASLLMLLMAVVSKQEIDRTCRRMDRLFKDMKDPDSKEE